MKKLIVLAAILGMALPISAFAGFVFEQNFDTGKMKMRMVWMTQGDYKRLDMYDGDNLKTSQISSPELKTPVFIMHDLKQYMVQGPMEVKKEKGMSAETMKDAMQSLGASGMSPEQKKMMEDMMKKANNSGNAAKTDEVKISAEDFSIKQTGEKKKISGYNAEKVQVLYKGNQYMNEWVTKDLPKDAIDAMNSFRNDRKMNPKSGDANAAALKAISDKVASYGFPVMVEIKHDKNTRHLYAAGESFPKGEAPEEIRIEMKKIEKKELPKAEFTVPAGYSEMKIPASR